MKNESQIEENQIENEIMVIMEKLISRFMYGENRKCLIHMKK